MKTTKTTKIYLLLGVKYWEHDTVLGAYASKKDAKEAQKIMEKQMIEENYREYDSFDIRERTLGGKPLRNWIY